MTAIRPFETINIRWVTDCTRPFAALKIGPMNEREAGESGLWLKAWVAPGPVLADQVREVQLDNKTSTLRPSTRTRSPSIGAP